MQNNKKKFLCHKIIDFLYFNYWTAKKSYQEQIKLCLKCIQSLDVFWLCKSKINFIYLLINSKR